MSETPTLDASLADLVGKAAEALETATATYGPDAVDLALEVGRLAAMRHIAFGVLMLGLAGTMLFLLIYWRESLDKETPGWRMFAYVSSGVAGALGLNTVLNFHAWVGMFRPEIYLAYEAIF